ncbi:MAG: YesL family protein [Lachnospiraceae bacterium]|nr:YesL family protein [Lachnospiraceae bacterium]
MFKLDSPLMNFLSKVADIMILNILIIVCSIPVFTVGAAVSAAYYMTFKMVKNEETYIVRGFFKAFKENFKQATVMWLLVLLIIGILSVDYTIIVYSGIEFSRWIRLAMVTVSMILLMGVVYMFPLQARFINPVKNTIKNSFLMALSHLPTTVLLIAVYAVPVVVFYFVPQSLPILILLAFGTIVYLKSCLLLRVFKRYEEALAVNTNASAKNPSEADSGIFAESDRIEREGRMVKVFRNGKFVEVPEKSLNQDKM